MASEEKETRIVNSSWILTNYSWKVEVDGLKLLMEGLKEKKIIGRKCHSCGAVYVPGVDYCRKCYIDIEEVVEVGTTGKVVTFTVNLADVRGNPLDEPQIICCFQIEGAVSWMMGTLLIDDWRKVHVGMPVKACFREEAKGELADIEHWEPVDS